MEGEGEGDGKVKGHVNGNPSSALTSTVMVNGVQYRFRLRSAESTISGSKAPKSSHYVDLSQYPPGTDIYHGLHWDEYRVVAKVPRWAHEKWLRKFQDPDGPEDTSPLRDAANAADGTSAIKKRPCEDLVENPSPTAAAAADGNHSDGKRPCEDPYAYFADPSEYDYQGSYVYVVKDGGRLVQERVSPILKVFGSTSYKEVRGGVYEKGGVYHTGKMPVILKVDAAGNVFKAAPN